jgi:hypothetical protein
MSYSTCQIGPVAPASRLADITGIFLFAAALNRARCPVRQIGTTASYYVSQIGTTAALEVSVMGWAALLGLGLGS